MKDDRLYLGHILEAIERIVLWDVVVNHIPPLRDKVRRAFSP